MKKYFKKPEDVSALGSKDLIKVLKKVFAKGVEGARFFYNTEFNYAMEEVAPFLFIGPAAGPWKRYIKENRTSKTYAAGKCRLHKDEQGGVKLQLQVLGGKGAKPMLLKLINKTLLKRLHIVAEFVDNIDIVLDSEEEDSSEEEKNEVQEELTEKLQEKASKVIEFEEDIKSINSVYNREKKEALYGKTLKWLSNYQQLDNAHKAKLKKEAITTKAIYDQVKQKLQLDNKISQQMEQVNAALDNYLQLMEAGEEKAAVLAEKLKKALDTILKDIKTVKDSALAEECEEILMLLA